jgi:hypothetical protein
VLRKRLVNLLYMKEDIKKERLVDEIFEVLITLDKLPYRVERGWSQFEQLRTDKDVKTQLRSLTEIELKEKLELLQSTIMPDDLKIHGRYFNKKLNKDILRVPSGWIYSDWDVEKEILINSVFVPLKN